MVDGSGFDIGWGSAKTRNPQSGAITIRAIPSWAFALACSPYALDGHDLTSHKMHPSEAKPLERRSRSPDDHCDTHREHRRSRSPHTRRHRHHHHHQHSSTQQVSQQPLPFRAQSLRRSDFASHEAMFGLYLDIQKQIVLESLTKAEIIGRWKSFVGKW